MRENIHRGGAEALRKNNDPDERIPLAEDDPDGERPATGADLAREKEHEAAQDLPGAGEGK
jgi:hypothetical protein